MANLSRLDDALTDVVAAKVDEALKDSNFHVELDDQVSKAVHNAVGEYDFNAVIEEAVDEYDIDSEIGDKVQSAIDDADIDTMVERMVESAIDDALQNELPKAVRRVLLRMLTDDEILEKLTVALFERAS